jgi:hypothetical protein
MSTYTPILGPAIAPIDPLGHDSDRGAEVRESTVVAADAC